jgi:hypothetical protein
MPIIVEQHETALIFRLVGDTYISAKTWEDTIDARVFDHELATGQTPRGFPLDDMWLKVAHLAHQQGIHIPPWYGTTQGAYCYEFQFTLQGLRLRCSNSETGDSLELVEHSAGLQPIPAADTSTRYMGFPIDGPSYQQLVAWECWEAQHARTSRYHYRFVPTTVIGIATVYDNKTGNEIDVTNYGDD